MNRLKTLQYACLVLLMLVTGVFWGTWLGLSRSISSISAATFLEIGNIMIANLAVPMRILMPLTLLLLIILAFSQRSLPQYATLGGLAFFLAALLITLTVNVPLDQQIVQWNAANLPADWQNIRDRWELYHLLRTVASLLSFALVLAGALMKDNQRS